MEVIEENPGQLRLFPIFDVEELVEGAEPVVIISRYTEVVMALWKGGSQCHIDMRFLTS